MNREPLGELLRNAWSAAPECPPGGKWAALAGGEPLAAAERAALADHAAGCPACAAELALAEAFAEAAAGGAAETDAASSREVEAIVARLRERGPLAAGTTGRGAADDTKPVAAGAGPARRGRRDLLFGGGAGAAQQEAVAAAERGASETAARAAGPAADGEGSAAAPGAEGAAALRGGDAPPSPATGRVLAFPDRGRAARTRWLSGLAAAAALAAAVGLWWGPGRTPRLPAPPIEGELRGGEVELAAPQGELSAPPERLRWLPLAGAARYQVEIVRADGTPLWQAEAAGSELALPAELAPRWGVAVRWSWRVTALDAAGGALARSEWGSFSIRPTGAR